MKLLFIFISTIYYFCTVKILAKIFNINVKKKQMFLSLFFIILIDIALAFILKNSIYLLLAPLLLCKDTIIIRLFFTKIKYTSLLYTYALLYSINGCISAYIIIITNTTNLIVSDLITNSITFIFCSLIFSFKLQHKILQLLNWIPKYIKILILIISYCEMILLTLLLNESLYLFTKKWFNFVQFGVASLSFLFLITIIFFVILAIRNANLKQISNNYEKQILIQAEHYQKIVESNREISRFRHDYKNISIAIEQLIINKNYSEALSLIKESNSLISNAENIMTNYKTGNSIADALLNDKQIQAAKTNVNIIFDGYIPSELLSPTDICVILGNSIDNAMEACLKCSETEIKNITIESIYSYNTLFLTIKNPVDKMVNIINNHILTTKTDKSIHGFGLYSLNAIINKYKGTLSLDSTDNTFTIDMVFNFNI